MSPLARPSRSAAFLLGAAVFLLLGLGAAYYFQTESTADRLARRNLRQLARIGRGVEARVDNFESILRNLGQELPLPERRAEGSAPAAGEESRRDAAVVAGEGEIRRAAGLVEGLQVVAVEVPRAGVPAPPSPTTPTLELLPGAPAARLTYRTAALDLAVEVDLRARLEPLLESAFFDELFLADASGRVFLQADGSGIRLQRIPGAPGEDGEGAQAKETGGVPASSVEDVEVVGERFKLFLQPVRLRLLRSEEAGGGAGEWTLGGLVSAGRFRSESLSLHPSRLLVLSLLLVSVILAWPFLKVWSMGPRERVEVMDVLFMGFSLLLASGVAALALVDLIFFPGFKIHLDEQLSEVSERLEGNLKREVVDAVAQLEALTAEFDRPGAAPRRTGILPANLPSAGGAGDWPYPFFEMAFWADAGGVQQGKWTVRSTTTSFVSVADREYFQRVRQGRLWQTREGEREVRFTLEPIRSINTGEALTAFALPYPGRDPGRKDWVAVLLARPVSFDHPLLPPGFGYAVIEPGGRTLWSSAPERALEENLFEETGEDALRSAVAARKGLHLDAAYLGRDVRVLTRALAGTPLTLVVMVDKEVLRTTNFEALLFALSLFLVYAAMLAFLFLGLYLARPSTRLAWAWPDRGRPLKHALLALVMVLFGAELFRQVALYGPQILLPTAFLLPVAAAGTGLLILTCGLDEWRRRRRAGWALVAASTALLLAAFARLGGQGASFMLYAMTLAVVGAGAAVVVLCERKCGRASFTGRGFRRAYLGSILACLVTLGLLPAAVFFRAVYFEHMKLLVRHGQLSLAQGLEERFHRQQTAFGAGSGVAERRLSYDADVAVQGFFQTCFWAHRERLPPAEGCELPTAEVRGAPREPWVHAGLADHLPFLNETSVATRHLFGSGAADRAWKWQAVKEADGGPIPGVTRERGLLLTAGPETEPRYEVFSRLRRFSPPWSLLWWLLLAGAAGTLFGLVRFQARRVFLLDLEAPGSGDLGEMAGRRIESSLLVVCPAHCDRAALAARGDLTYLDLREVAAGADGAPALPPPSDLADRPLVCLDHADHRLAEPTWNHALLAWLEEAVFRRRRKVVLLADEDPDRSLVAAAPAGEGGDAAAAAERRAQRERWTALLGSFVKVTVASAASPDPFRRELADRRAALEGGPGGGGEAGGGAPAGGRRNARAHDEEVRDDGARLDELFAVLAQECAGDPALERIGRQALGRSDFLGLTPGALVDQVREAADGYYRSLWTRLAPEERLLLAQLAQGSLVNPSARRPLRRLLTLGLLARDPALRLRNESLARFIEETARPEDLRSWEAAEGGSTWQQVRPALLFSLVALAVFLFATQRQLFDTSMGFISAVTVGLPALFKLLGLLRKPGTASDAGG